MYPHSLSGHLTHIIHQGLEPVQQRDGAAVFLPDIAAADLQPPLPRRHPHGLLHTAALS